MPTRFSHELRTPTFALTTIGVVSLAATRFGLPYSPLVAFLAFLLAAGGVAMALGSEVTAKQEKWEWDGIARSLRRPTPTFWWQVCSHLPQLLVALWLPYCWYRSGGKKRGD